MAQTSTTKLVALVACLTMLFGCHAGRLPGEDAGHRLGQGVPVWPVASCDGGVAGAVCGTLPGPLALMAPPTRATKTLEWIDGAARFVDAGGGGGGTWPLSLANGGTGENLAACANGTILMREDAGVGCVTVSGDVVAFTDGGTQVVTFDGVRVGDPYAVRPGFAVGQYLGLGYQAELGDAGFWYWTNTRQLNAPTAALAPVTLYDAGGVATIKLGPCTSGNIPIAQLTGEVASGPLTCQTVGGDCAISPSGFVTCTQFNGYQGDAGEMLLGQGGGAAPAFYPISGNCTLSAYGYISCSVPADELIGYLEVNQISADGGSGAVLTSIDPTIQRGSTFSVDAGANGFAATGAQILYITTTKDAGARTVTVSLPLPGTDAAIPGGSYPSMRAPVTGAMVSYADVLCWAPDASVPEWGHWTLSRTAGVKVKGSPVSPGPTHVWVAEGNVADAQVPTGWNATMALSDAGYWMQVTITGDPGVYTNCQVQPNAPYVR